MELSDHEKAGMFDAILEGRITGMSVFWRNVRELQGKDEYKILSKMAQFAAIEAIELQHEINNEVK